MGLYDVLLAIEPSPVVKLNRAAAVAMTEGAEEGIRLISEILASGELKNYHRAYAARGELFRRLGDFANARTDFEVALTLVRQEPERRFIEARLAEIS